MSNGDNPRSWLLNFTDLNIHHQCPHCCVMFVLYTIEVFNLRILLSLCENKTKFTAHPSLNWLTLEQYTHHPNVKSVRINGQITEVKQPRLWVILRGVIIWHPSFFSLAEMLGKLRKIASSKGILKNLE